MRSPGRCPQRAVLHYRQIWKITPQDSAIPDPFPRKNSSFQFRAAEDGLIITGATTALLALIGNAQAIQNSTREHPEARARWEWVWLDRHAQTPAGTPHFSESGNRRGDVTSPPFFILASSGTVPHARGHQGRWPWPQPAPGPAVVTLLNTPLPTAAATSLPDGGATVLLLGGILSGLVWLKTKLTA